MTVSFLGKTTATAKTNVRDLEAIDFEPMRLPRSESQATDLHRWVKGAATFESIRTDASSLVHPKERAGRSSKTKRNWFCCAYFGNFL
jgi:hypothetical protein